MPAPFVHLHVHSHYSLLGSTVRLDQLVRRARDQGAPAVALTDDGNLFGAVELCREARAAGIRPILGCDVYVARGSRHDRPEAGGREQEPWRLVLLAEDEAGYRSLARLVSLGFLEGLHQGRPHVDRELLERHHAGLIALSGGRDGEVETALRSGRADQARAAATWLRDAFGASSFFLELQDHGQSEDRELNARLADLAAAIGVGTVATNDCRFLAPEDYEAYRALTCIGTGTTLDDPRETGVTPQHFFRSPEEMAAVFADWPAALAATAAIASRCDFAIVEAKEPALPHFEVPSGETIDSYLRSQARRGLQERRQEWADAPAGARREIALADYEARLARELDVICEMGFPGYFLIVWDVIRFAREQGIPVGPGRGSAAGSLVAYALRITDLNPLQHGLLFERFLNPERKSLPDIDMDFCQRRRGEVIRHVQQRYGEDHVAQIITFGTLNARSAIRDVGRVMNMTYGECDRIAKLIPEELGVTLDKALHDSPVLEDLRRSDERVARLIATARALEGLARNAGVHAAGVIIAPRPLLDLAPLFKTGRNEITTQYVWEEAEWIGLVKMDFLGLKTLTVLDDAVKSIEASDGVRVSLASLPMDDPKTFELFQAARTSGIFQFESSGMRDVLRKLHPETYEDLIALNALYRPGPLKSGMVDDFVNRRHGKVKVSYPHASLEPILKPTYGVIVYQEQVMQIAATLAGFSLGEADNLRKAMGKKKADVMAAQKDVFIQGATARRIDPRKAGEIFDLMEHFAGYGFNRSHSAAYALVAYWSAWLKAHHPSHFMAALLTSDGDNTAKVVRYIAECKEMGLEVLPPDVNESNVDFTPIGRDKIRFGLSAIKGVGRAAVTSILEARERVGRFDSLDTFCAEIDLRLNNKKVLEALVKAGALDSLGAGRSSLMFALDGAGDRAQASRTNRETGQASLFGATAALPSEPRLPAAEMTRMPEWPARDRLRYEKEVLGFYVSGHPLQDHEHALRNVTSARLADLAERDGREVTVAGIVTALRKTRTKKGDWMAFITIEDLTGHAEVIAFPEAWKVAQQVVEMDAALCIRGNVEVDGDRGKILASAITPLGKAEGAAARGLLVQLPASLAAARLEGVLAALAEAFRAHPGSCPVTLEVTVPDLGAVAVEAASRYSVDPTPALFAALEAVVGPDGACLIL